MTMEQVEVAIIGGGLAGSALAAVLNRRGVSAALYDLHDTYPPDFRAEKLTKSQIEALDRLGLAEPVVSAATQFDELCIARFGKIVERRPNLEYGIDYAALVNALRGTVPDAFRRTVRVARIEASDTVQTILLGDGTAETARLVVIATGLGRTLLDGLGIRRLPTTATPSLAIGFDLTFPSGSPSIAPLTYHGESPLDRSAYLTIFPIADRARANLFVYRSRDEGWARDFRDAPKARLLATMPGLRDIIGDFEVDGTPVLRPIHLYSSEGHVRDGAVLIGDAFATTCPTGGTGIDKVLTDVERLAALIPAWLASEGMSRTKIATFYDDPVKRACDENARSMTDYARLMAIDESAAWVARRYRNFYVQRLRYWLRRRLGPARTAAAGGLDGLSARMTGSDRISGSA